MAKHNSQLKADSMDYGLTQCIPPLNVYATGVAKYIKHVVNIFRQASAKLHI
jgi:hypothetical protein